MSIWFEESIPIEKSKLIQILRNNIPESQRQSFDHFARLFDHYYLCKFNNILNLLYDYYQPFNANNDTPIRLDEAEEQRYARNIIDKFRNFLEQAQYQKIGEHDIRDILKQTQAEGLKIVFPAQQYSEFLVYYRDEEVSAQYTRSWRWLWLRKRCYYTPYYKRLAILFHPFRRSFTKRIKDELPDDTANELQDVSLPQPIILKLFKNIRQDYLPITLPGILLKITFARKLWLLSLLLLTTIAGIAIAIVAPLPWYGLIALLPFLMFLQTISRYDRHSKHYYRRLLSYFYHKNVSNNSGVLSHLIHRISEETYKQNFLVLYAFWTKHSWAIQPISMHSLVSYLRHFMLEYFGIQVKLNLENILPELVLSSATTEPTLPPFLQTRSAFRTYLSKDALRKGGWLDSEDAQQPLPYAGLIDIAPGTAKSEQSAFYRDPFILHLVEPQGLQFSHDAGSAVRWLIDKPYHARLKGDCSVGGDFLVVEEEDVAKLPVQGIGKVIVNDETFEFRYHRRWGDNRLALEAGLRYRHIPSKANPVLVRPILPNFTLGMDLAGETCEIPLTANVVFPEQGLVKLINGNSYQITPYRLRKTDAGSFLILHEKSRAQLTALTVISLTPPLTTLKYHVSRKTWLLPVQDTRYFHKRGWLILSPGSDYEERVPFRGEVLRLKLDKALQYRHGVGSIVQIKNTLTKTNITHKTRRNADSIMIQCLGEEIGCGEIIIEPGEENQEIRSFTVSDKFFDLARPTRFVHPVNHEVWESRLESPLRYPAFQGRHIITIEDATYFPLSGTMEIHFNGSDGVKEVFPFVRTQCSNTLILKAQADRHLPSGALLLVTAVEITTDTSYHYQDAAIHANFSCVPDFPLKGKVAIESGSQTEETVMFQRYPQRLYLQKPLRSNHSVGTALDFSSYMEFVLSEPLREGQDRVYWHFCPLLPNRGCLYLKNKHEEIEVIWYRKRPHRVMLQQPCQYHYHKGTVVRLPTLDSMSLASKLERGDQQARVLNAHDLPERGRLEIKGFFRSLQVEFVRKGDILYFRQPVAYSFNHASLQVPDLYLSCHLATGMDYLELSDSTLLATFGELSLEPDDGLFSRRKAPERIAFQYRPDTLWLDKPIEKRYDPGTVVISPELLTKGAGYLQADSLSQSVNKLQKVIASLYENHDNSINLAPNNEIREYLSITQTYLQNKPR